MIYACNVADEDLAEGNAFVEAIKKRSGGESVVVVSAQVESELVSLDSEDRDEFLDALGVTLEGCGLRALVRTAYDTLGLITYYTSGPTESRAWTIREGWLAPQAAGVIHGDFERGFIKAETVGYEALVDAGDEKAAKEAGPDAERGQGVRRQGRRRHAVPLGVRSTTRRGTPVLGIASAAWLSPSDALLRRVSAPRRRRRWSPQDLRGQLCTRRSFRPSWPSCRRARP